MVDKDNCMSAMKRRGLTARTQSNDPAKTPI